MKYVIILFLQVLILVVVGNCFIPDIPKTSEMSWTTNGSNSHLGRYSGAESWDTKHITSMRMARDINIVLLSRSDEATRYQGTNQQSTNFKQSKGGYDQVHIQATDSGIRFGIWPGKPKVPAPTLLFFGGAIEEMLRDDYQRQCGNILAEKGYICILIDGPCEGKELRPGEQGGLSGWRNRLENGENFIPEANSRASELLDYLIAQGYTDPENIVACGISRGGFLAMHFTISEPRVKCTAVYCPVINLGTLQIWFKGAEQHPAIRSVDLMEHADKLVGRPLWIVLGDQDRPIDTDYVIGFARKISRLSGQNSQIEMHVIAEPNGHTIPAGSDKMSASWILKQVEKKNFE